MLCPSDENSKEKPVCLVVFSGYLVYLSEMPYYDMIPTVGTVQYAGDVWFGLFGVVISGST